MCRHLLTLLVLSFIPLSLFSQSGQENEIRRLRDQIRHLEEVNMKLQNEVRRNDRSMVDWIDNTEDVLDIMDTKLLAAAKNQQQLDQTLRKQIVDASGIAALRADRMTDEANFRFYLTAAICGLLLIGMFTFYYVTNRRIVDLRGHLVGYFNETSDSMHRDIRNKIASRADKLQLELAAELQGSLQKVIKENKSDLRKVSEDLRTELMKQEERVVLLFDTKIQQVRDEQVNFIVPSMNPTLKR